jgi:MFS family permease
VHVLFHHLRACEFFNKSKHRHEGSVCGIPLLGLGLSGTLQTLRDTAVQRQNPGVWAGLDLQGSLAKLIASRDEQETTTLNADNQSRVVCEPAYRLQQKMLPEGHGDQRVFASAGFIATGISLAAFTETFLYGLIIPLLPFTLVERAKVPQDHVQTYISALLSAYGAGSILGSVVSGVLASLEQSSRLQYLSGLVSLAASTAMLAFARSMPVLVIARALQGLSSAAVWTVGLMILNAVAPESEKGNYMGYIGAAAAAGAMAGPVVGGIVYDAAGYYPVFAVAGALIVVDIAFRLAMRIPQSTGVSEDVDAHNSNVTNNAEVAETTSLLPNSERERVIPSNRYSVLKAFLSPQFLAALVGAFTDHILLTGLETILPTHAATNLHWSSSMISSAFMLLVLPALFSFVVGRLSDKVGPGVVCAGGCFLCVPGFVGLSFVTHGGRNMEALLLAMMLVIGVGISGIITPVMSVIGSIAANGSKDGSEQSADDLVGRARKARRKIDEDRLAGIGYSMINIVMMMAAITGPLICGWIVQRAGWQVAIVVLAAVCTFAGSTTALFLGPPVGKLPAN